MMKSKSLNLILILAQILLLFALGAGSAAAASSCCSAGGGSSYNFLGDSAVNTDMQSQGEFIKEGLVSSSLSVGNMPAGSYSRMSLDLNDTRSVYLILSRTGTNLTGEGSMRGLDGTETLAADGFLDGNAMALNVTASGGSLFEFSLTAEGSRVSGEFRETLAGGRIAEGEAEGRWMPE